MCRAVKLLRLKRVVDQLIVIGVVLKVVVMVDFVETILLQRRIHFVVSRVINVPNTRTSVYVVVAVSVHVVVKTFADYRRNIQAASVRYRP